MAAVITVHWRENLARYVYPWRRASRRVAWTPFARLAAASRPLESDTPSVEHAREATFDALFTGMERSIYGYLWRMLGDQQAAADLTQETFLRAWRHIDKLTSYASPEAWLWRVATNLALSERRRRAIRRSEPLDDASERLAASDPSIRLAIHDQIHATLLKLTPQLRAALTLREVYGLSFEEVGQALGISPASARVTLSRAREQFRQRYQRTEATE